MAPLSCPLTSLAGTRSAEPSIALERFVRLHGVGAHEDDIAAELWFMARHFHFKTGCSVYLPNLKEPAHPLIRAAKRFGEGVLTNLASKVVGG